MKRSQMLQLMAETLEHESPSRAYYYEFCKKLLAKMEEAGIKPPHHSARFGSVWCSSTNWHDDVYAWEDE